MSAATEKQIAFASKLVGEVAPLQGTDPDRIVICQLLSDQWASAVADRAVMSAYLDALLGFKNAWTQWDAATPADEPEAGIYRIDGGVLVRVYLGQNTGRMLAKRVDVEQGTVSYIYLGRAARVLPPNAVRLSLEEVGSLGASFGHCVLCGRRLDDPESVDRGIGPVCADKY